MSLAGLVGADHALYYERARVLLPFRTGARTYLGETAFRYYQRLRERASVSARKPRFRSGTLVLHLGGQPRNNGAVSFHSRVYRG